MFVIPRRAILQYFNFSIFPLGACDASRLKNFQYFHLGDSVAKVAIFSDTIHKKQQLFLKIFEAKKDVPHNEAHRRF